jgi:hypothetical protein
MSRPGRVLLAAVVLTTLSGCVYKSVSTFPEANQLFITSGDGDIQKPYTPIGQLIYRRDGYRIPLPILGMLPIDDVDPDLLLRTEVFTEVRARGGDGLINMRMDWQPAKPGFLGLFASGGSLIITGTIIKR